MMSYDENRPVGKMTTPFNLSEIMTRQEANPDLIIGITKSSDLKWPQKAMLDSYELQKV